MARQTVTILHGSSVCVNDGGSSDGGSGSSSVGDGNGEGGDSDGDGAGGDDVQAVVSACGALNTPALLLRSKVRSSPNPYDPGQGEAHRTNPNVHTSTNPDPVIQPPPTLPPLHTHHAHI